MSVTSAGSASGAGELAGRVAIVTGAASGIGRATARRMAHAGATVMLADCDEARGNEAAAALAGEGCTARFFRVDVTREDEVRALVLETVAAYGSLDVLANNAGIKGSEVATAEVDAAEFERVLAVNLTGTFLTMKHGIAAMLAGRGGAVVNNASMLAMVGVAHHAAYAASKGGVVQLTRTAAIEYASRNVRVNCLCPGFTDSEMVNRNVVTYAKVLVPMGRLATPDEIADVAVFLASDRAAYITGAAIPVDGGYTAR
jgi:NAD(P)-dependent dehydrogenase (short-subunit alcohol dehydrogenase family)